MGHSLRGVFYNTEIQKLGGYRCESPDYRFIKTFLKHCPISDRDVIVDFGCGKGRLFHYLCAKGFKGKCIGIELWKEVALQTREDLAKYDNVTIVHNNFLNYEFPEDFTLVYYFNSANREVTSELIKKLESHGNRVKLVYINAVYADLVKKRKDWRVKEKFKTRFRISQTIHSIILEYNPM